MIKTVKSETLKKWLENQETYLIDVREVAEYQEAAIKDSHLMPLSQFSGENFAFRDKKVVIHCRSGMRSMTACERLNQHYPDLEIYNLEGGILAWANCGFEIIKG